MSVATIHAIETHVEWHHIAAAAAAAAVQAGGSTSILASLKIFLVTHWASFTRVESGLWTPKDSEVIFFSQNSIMKYPHFS